MGETVAGVVQQAGGGFDFSFVIMMVAMFAIVYFLMIRPQRKQQADHQALVNSLKKGDEVVLSSGLIGKIFAVEDKVITVDLGGNARVRVLKGAVSSHANRVLGTPEKKALDDKSEKAEKADSDKSDKEEGEAEGESEASSDDKGKKKGKKKTA